MRVEITHHIDCSERDATGSYDWYYEYQIFRYSENGTTLLVRSYLDEPEEAHFLRVEQDQQGRSFQYSDSDTPLVRAAMTHLRDWGKKHIRRLGTVGYEPV